jgi:hypothetical protein
LSQKKKGKGIHMSYLFKTSLHRAVIAMSLLPLISCTAISPPRVPPSNIIKQRLDNLQTLSRQPLCDKSLLKSDTATGSTTTSCPAVDVSNSPFMAPAEYARAGYTIVDENCNDFFDTLSRATNTLQMSKSDWTALGAAAAAILALAHSTAKPVGITAAAFGFGSIAFDNYQKYALLTPYPDQTKKLVIQALKAYEKDSPPGDATDMIGADARVSGYAQICTYSSIASLAQEAINKATASVPNGQGGTPSIFTSSEQQAAVTHIKNLLGLADQTPSDTDLALIAVLSDSKQAKYFEQAASHLSPFVAAKVWDAKNAKPLVDVLQKLDDDLKVLETNGDFVKMITDSEKSSDEATKKAGPGVRGGPPSAVFIAPSPPSKSGKWSPPTIVVNPN